MSLAIGSFVPDTQAPAFRSVGAFCLRAAITRGGKPLRTICQRSPPCWSIDSMKPIGSGGWSLNPQTSSLQGLELPLRSDAGEGSNGICIKSLTQRFEEIGSSIWQFRPSDSIFVSSWIIR
jgi:hypothetical protein